MRKEVVIVLIAVGILIGAGFGSSEKVQLSPRGDLQCGDTIYTDTTLTSDILGCEDDGLVVGADNIVLDCAEHIIGGNEGTNGIVVDQLQEVTIRNCITSGFYRGIDVDESQSITIEFSELRENGRGVDIYNSSDIGLRYNLLHDNTYAGVQGSKATDNWITHNEIYENSDGVYFFDSSDIRIKYNRIQNNSNYGIGSRATNQMQTYRNTVKNNKFGEYRAHSEGGTVRENTFEDNEFGIDVDYGSSNRISSNEFKNNWRYNALASDQDTPDDWTGNWWSDFEENEGYPDNYIIPGLSGAVDCCPIPSSETPIECADWIRGDITLTEDLSCSGYLEHGLSIVGDDLTIDCNGHEIAGTGSSVLFGIRVWGKNNTIQNCRITGFQAGIIMHPRHALAATPTKNIIQNNTFIDNYFGDGAGIIFARSNDNIIRNNTMEDNSGYGVLLEGDCSSNLFYANDFINNNVWMFLVVRGLSFEKMNWFSDFLSRYSLIS